MSTLTDAAEELRRLEAMVAEQFALIDVPKAPDYRGLEELAPIPESRAAVERLAGCVAAAGVICGLFLT